MQKYILAFLLFFSAQVWAEETMGMALEKVGFKTELYKDLRVKHFIKIDIHNGESTKLVAENDFMTFSFEFFPNYTAQDFDKFKEMFYRPFFGEDIGRFNAHMFVLMGETGCQKNYLPTETRMSVSRAFPILVYRGMDTIKKSWRFSCKPKDTLGVNYWGVFYQSNKSRVITFTLNFKNGHDDELGLRKFLLDLKAI